MAQHLAGHYEIVRELGRGGMGVVYLANDHRVGRQVAIKELSVSQQVLPDEMENIIARFQREAQAAAKLQHPNIVSVHEYLVEGGKHFMVMEYLVGKSIQSYIDARQAFPFEQVVDVGAQVCAALDYAHAHQIVHRDIKPDNVLLLENGRIKLMDFGVARHTGEVSKLTQAGTTLGTIAYISPEQLCDSRLVDGRSDLFSLGAMLYEMLTLRTPFDAGNVGGTIMKIMSEDPVPPRQMNPAIPPRLEAVIMRSLRKSPDERFGRANEMGQALVNALRSEAAAGGAAPRPVQLNVVTCRACGTAVPGGRGPCPKCGRLQAPGAPAGPAQGGAAPLPPAGPLPSAAVGQGVGRPAAPRPGAPAPRPAAPGGAGGAWPAQGTGHLPGAQPPAAAPIRPGFPARGGTGPLGRAGKAVSGLRFLHSFGAPGFGPGEFQQPRGMALDASKHLHVCDTDGGRIQVFDPQGVFLRELRPAPGRDSFRFPRSLAISSTNGRLYVVDELDFRIYVLEPDGRQSMVWDRRRNPQEASVVPGRLTIGQTGTIYVSEPNARRVVMYTATHGPQGSLGSPGELQSPSGLAVGPRAQLYVLDYGACKVQVYDSRGKGMASFGRRGAGLGEFAVPRDLVVDRLGFVFVADTLNHRVQVFGPDGQLITHVGSKGKGEGAFAGPEGLALSSDDLLYVSDRGNGRVQVFQVERA